MIQLFQARFICTTADCWSTRRKSFLGVTVNWFNNDLKRKSACLAIRRVVDKCDYELIAKLLESIHGEFKITATITDRGSSFVKAFHLFATNTTISTSTIDERQQLPDVMDHATYSSDLSDSDQAHLYPLPQKINKNLKIYFLSGGRGNWGRGSW
jgi:hypothetical protein